MFYTQELPTAKLTAAEAIGNPRFRGAIIRGEYTRALAVFLHLQYPDVPDLSDLPREITQSAKKRVDEAFFSHLSAIEEMEQEMR